MVTYISFNEGTKKRRTYAIFLLTVFMRLVICFPERSRKRNLGGWWNNGKADLAEAKTRSYTCAGATWKYMYREKATKGKKKTKKKK